MRKWLVFSIVHAWLLATVVIAAEVDAQQPPASSTGAPAVERFTLANGLTVILERDVRQPTIAGAVVYRVGQRDDPPGYRGLAHLVEHMAVRGSLNLPKRAGMAEYEAIGARANAMTTADFTTYLAEFPARHLPRFLWIESDRMGFTLEAMTEEELEVERKVVRNEYRERSSGRHIWELIQRATAPEGHPYRAMADELVDPDELGFDAVRWFFQRHYRPDNATLVLVGHFDLGRARALIERYFGTLKSTGELAPRPPAPGIAFGGSQRMRFAAQGGLANVAFRWSVPCGAEIACRARLTLLATLIDRVLDPSSLQQAEFKALDVDLAAREQHMELTVTATLYSPADGDRVRALLDRELDRLRSGQLEAEALRSAQHAHAVATLYRQESLMARALAFVYRPDASDEAVLEATQRQTLRDIAAAAAELLPAQRRLVIEIEPSRNAIYEGELSDSEGALAPTSRPAAGAGRVP